VKKISVVVPCYNDSNSIEDMHQRLTAIFAKDLPHYDYEIIFVDDYSPDNTWDKIKSVCAADSKVKGARNMRNFGFFRNVFSCVLLGKNADATFLIYGDTQDPPEVLPDFVKHWEDGYRAVMGQRKNSYNSFFIKILRRIYYKLLSWLTKSGEVEGISAFGLYDKNIVNVLHQIQDPQPYLPGIVSEYVKDIKIVPVTQEEGGRGFSNINFWGRYDAAMVAITSNTKMLLRLTTFFGAVIGFFCMIFAAVVLVQKLLFWDAFDAGTPSIIIGIFFLGAVQLFFLGIIGEYVLTINNRSMHRPLVIIDEKINFAKEENKEENTKEKEEPKNEYDQNN